MEICTTGSVILQKETLFTFKDQFKAWEWQEAIESAIRVDKEAIFVDGWFDYFLVLAAFDN